MSASDFEQRAWAMVAAALDYGDGEASAELTDGLVHVELEVLADTLAAIVARLLLGRLDHGAAVAMVRAITLGYAAQASIERLGGDDDV